MSTGAQPSSQDDLYQYLNASNTLENTRSQVEALEQTEAVEAFHTQMALLRRRLLKEPKAFRDMFIADGAHAIVWEFQQAELSPGFIRTMWDLMLKDDDTSKVLMRFVWNVPLKLKRKFVRAIDATCRIAIRCSRACRKIGRPTTTSRPISVTPSKGRPISAW